MNELLPIFLGMLLGLSTHWIPVRRRRIAALASGSIAFGTIATFVTGEHLISWGLVLIDIPMVLATASAAAALAYRIAGRRTAHAAKGPSPREN